MSQQALDLKFTQNQNQKKIVKMKGDLRCSARMSTQFHDFFVFCDLKGFFAKSLSKTCSDVLYYWINELFTFGLE